MPCPICDSSGLVALPQGAAGEWCDLYWCTCVPEHDPRRFWHPTRLDLHTYRIAFPDWRERVRGWARRQAEREPMLARAAAAKAAAIAGDGREGE